MPFLRAYTPRHAKPSKAAPALAVGGLTATLGAVSGGTANAASDNDFARLRACESGGNYAINTGNGFYGAYQFDRRTWQGLGYPGTANQASPATQDEAAARLQAARGWQPWPACSRKLGLGRSVVSGSGDRQVVTERSSVRASRSAERAGNRRIVVSQPTRPAVRPTTAPEFIQPLTTALVKDNVHEVRQWQHRMRARGWDVVVDGRFGAKSARVAARFAAEKQIRVTPGTVNQQLWEAAWESPVA